jgi:hypothetical protein
MAVRIRFIYLLIIILISFGTMLGCDQGFCGGRIQPFGCPPDPLPPCNKGEVRCRGECVPGVECCFDQNFHEFVDACLESKPYCCPAGECASDFISCPDVTECPEDEPQLCGPFCIGESDDCCNGGRTDIEPIFCTIGTKPVCCTDGSGKCAATEECCGEGFSCGVPPDFGPPPASFDF